MIKVPKFAIYDTFALYEGIALDATRHEHAAIQLILSPDSSVSVEQEDGSIISGKALLINPLVSHAVLSAHFIYIIYIEAQSRLGFALTDIVGDGEIESLPLNSLPDESIHQVLQKLLTSNIQFSSYFHEQQLADLFKGLPSIRSREASIDKRIDKALSFLAENPREHTVKAAAQCVALSDSRLRTLVREQLEIPLATLLVWRKLRTAIQAMLDGQSLIDAATEGGFSDQAHFIRIMRRMFGVTPTVVKQFLCQKNHL